MREFMEEQGQHYDQCVKEVKGYSRVFIQAVISLGPVSLITFNDDSLCDILGEPVGREFEGNCKSYVIIMN